jgi:transcriptional regulator with XRE-family HTH domain
MKRFDTKSLAKAVKQYRIITLDIGLREAAIKAGTTAATLCRIENGRTAEIDTLLNVCDWLNVPITKFIKPAKQSLTNK